jgi:hypothetical protein
MENWKSILALGWGISRETDRPKAFCVQGSSECLIRVNVKGLYLHRAVLISIL